MKKYIIISWFLFLSNLVWGQPPLILPNEYYKGVSHAYEFSKLKQERPLFNIDSTNSLLDVVCRPEWKCDPETKGTWEDKGKFKANVRVKMVTLASSAANMYLDYLGNKRKYPLQGRIIWVTAFPELKNFCKNLSDKNHLKATLEKYFGLPPDTTKEKVVTLWAKPDDLFRPCYDPDITKTSCPSNYPKGVPREHVTWLDETIIKSFPYLGTGTPYPFTRMGFTYFWGNPKTSMGASEYVVKPNAKIYVESVETIEEYCR